MCVQLGVLYNDVGLVCLEVLQVDVLLVSVDYEGRFIYVKFR